ncbi:extracellular solute-binding protein [Kineosporia sp. J2-2]|uniref:Extracellular solute-binding protein n=1 Tax=Kineosporia corallincola TaxID=2835133 RepID=A0ABS5TDW4_9ACTN|nr:extracellular solute-binding protein [Kineosporia corallincola]MBT0769028.1 extracellular solute-binding protein [Kineosporia corallincola]
MRQRRIVTGGALALAAALLVSACGGGSDSADSAEEINTSPTGDGQTLTVWTYEDETSAMGIAWKKAMEQFTEETGAQVDFQLKSFEQINASASQVLNSDSAPDILEYNKGNATSGLLSSQGLLTDLTPAVEAYGWADKLSESLQTTARYSEDGVMGSGNYYGIPNYGEYVQVYYNKDLFEKYGLEVPTTLDEFTAVLQKFKDEGITPLAESAQEYPLGQLLYQLALLDADRQWVTDYQTYTAPADFHDASWTRAANTLKEWVDKGFISKNSTGQKAQDAGDAFTAGTNPIFFSGSWWYGSFTTDAKFDWGTFLFPGAKLSPGSSGNLWVVPENSDAKDLAYKFIDITMSPEIQNLMGNSGGIPVAADESAITDEKSKELIKNFTTLTGQDGLAFYPDWPTPTFYGEINAALQELVNGTKSVDEVLTQLQTDYDKGVKEITG